MLCGANLFMLCTPFQALTVSSENILPANPDILDGVDDLTQLSYLNEPSILYNLQNRHSHNAIYVSFVLYYKAQTLTDIL